MWLILHMFSFSPVFLYLSMPVQFLAVSVDLQYLQGLTASLPLLWPQWGCAPLIPFKLYTSLKVKIGDLFLIWGEFCCLAFPLHLENCILLFLYPLVLSFLKKIFNLFNYESL